MKLELNTRSPVFIIGNPRSGTTLLRLMLTSHHGFCIPPECGFLIWFFDSYKDWGSSSLQDARTYNKFINDLCQAKKFDTWQLSKEELALALAQAKPYSYSRLVEVVYLTYARKIGKNDARWGDKNNYYLNHIETISLLFPNAVFLHITRDCRDVVCSYRSISKRQITSKHKPNLPDDLLKATCDWNNNIDKIRKSFDRIKWRNVVEIRYEDLVRNPEAELRNLCLELGEEFDSHMLNFAELNKNGDLEPQEFLQWKERTVEPISTMPVGRYRNELSDEELKVVGEIASSNMKLYGYS